MGNNIAVPFNSFIYGGVRDDSEVVIVGRAVSSAGSFSINLCTGKALDKGDIAFHLNPRFQDFVIVRNHKQGSSWGAEERNGGLPFKAGQDFIIAIKAFRSGYTVTVNRFHFCDFNHRIPMEQVQYLYIAGDVIIDSVHAAGDTRPEQPPPYQPSMSSMLFSASSPLLGASPMFSQFPASSPLPGDSSMFSQYPKSTPPAPQPIYNPSVPLHVPIPGGMFPGKILNVSGAPHRNPTRFHINLACGFDEHCDLALHFDVRFRFGKDTHVVVRTHRQGKYGCEERHMNYFPFLPGVNFEVMILCEPQCFKIAVNDNHFVDFHHRILPLNRIAYMQVKGDVNISQIRFQ